MRPRLGWVLAVVAFIGMWAVECGLAKQSRMMPVVNARGTGVYALAGEFRSVFANLLWIKADRYHHEFLQRNSSWTQNKDLLGMMTLIVALDPTFEEAYSSGAYMYVLGEKRPDKGLAFVEEGLRNNPRSWELHKIAAILCARYNANYPLALKHARISLRLCDDAFYKHALKKTIRAIEKLAADDRAPHV